MASSTILRPTRASAAASPMASFTTASMASPTVSCAATICSIPRTDTDDGYGVAEKLACNRAAVPISRHSRHASLLHGAYYQWHLSTSHLRGLWHLGVY